MSIKYTPQNGSILICDYDGIVPEMVKRRPVVVIASVSPRLCMVVPLSTTPPNAPKPWVIQIELDEPLPFPYLSTTCWAKCDMVSSVAFDRLNLFRDGKDAGKRIYLERKVSSATLAAIRSGVWQAISYTR